MLSDETERVKSLYFILVQAALFSNVGITAQELSGYLDISPNTLRTMLKKIPQDLLITNKSEKEYHYLMNLGELDGICPR